MANLEGMPIGSLPEATDIQDEDEIVVYRPSTGKAYQANTDLIDSLNGASISYRTLNSGLSHEIAYNSYCIIFVFRSNTFGIYAADQWSAVDTAVSKTNISVTAADRVATITNNTTGYVALMVLAY